MKQTLTTLIFTLVLTSTIYSQVNTNTDHHTEVHTNHHSNNHQSNHHHDSETKKYKVNFSSGTLEIHGVGELEVLSTTGSDVIIESDVEDQDRNDRSKGLKSLNSAGIDDNTGMGISANVEGSKLTVTQISNDCNCNGVKIYVPKSVKISISNKNSQSDNIVIDNIDNEIIISTLYQSVYLNNITGPMSVKTIYGEVEANFTKVSQAGSISINAVYGLVDVSLPSSTKANLELSASYGEILSDMNVEVEKSGDMRNLSSTKVKGTLNGGGVLISLKSSYENLYLRSK